MRPERKLTAPQARAAAILQEHGGPFSPREFALAMWPDSPGWTRRTRGRNNRSGALGGTMPMKGARLLWTLFDLGLAAERDGKWYSTGLDVT